MYCKCKPKLHFFSEFVLHDLNRTVDEEIGREVFDYSGFPENQDNVLVISYKNVSVFLLFFLFLEIKIRIKPKNNHLLRTVIDDARFCNS